jgi:hypothetical protein
MLKKCPKCDKESLLLDRQTGRYQCLNPRCRIKLSEIKRKPNEATSATGPATAAGEPNSTKSQILPLSLEKNYSEQSPEYKFPDWSSLIFSLRRVLNSRVFNSIAKPFTSKLFLSLLVIAGLVELFHEGYVLFTHQIEPIKGTIIFVVEIAAWFWIVSILRHHNYRQRKPSFKLVFGLLFVIVLVCTFAGIEPMSSTKDWIIELIRQGLTSL